MGCRLHQGFATYLYKGIIGDVPNVKGKFILYQIVQELIKTMVHYENCAGCLDGTDTGHPNNPNGPGNQQAQLGHVERDRRAVHFLLQCIKDSSFLHTTLSDELDDLWD